eukprot:4693562-Lingulodinium_polyedra.AAC.1
MTLFDDESWRGRYITDKELEDILEEVRAIPSSSIGPGPAAAEAPPKDARQPLGGVRPGALRQAWKEAKQ